MTETVTPRAWDRLPNEDTLWYDRFCIYRDLGPIRSVNRAYKRYRSIHDPNVSEPDRPARGNAPTEWYDICKRYDWPVRATAFDDWAREGADDRVRDMMRQWREKANRDLQAVWDDLVGQWKEAPDDMTKYQVSQAMKTVVRTIADTAPGTGKSNVQFRVVLNNLPPEMQKALAEALGEEK